MTTDEAVTQLTTFAMGLPERTDGGELLIFQLYARHKAPRLRAAMHRVLDTVIDRIPDEPSDAT